MAEKSPSTTITIVIATTPEELARQRDWVGLSYVPLSEKGRHTMLRPDWQVSLTPKPLTNLRFRVIIPIRHQAINLDQQRL